MSYEFKKLSEVQALTEVPEGAKVLAETNGQIVRVPGSRLGGGIKTAIIKDSLYDQALSGVQSYANPTEPKPAITYSCINMTFEEAYETLASGEPMKVHLMFSKRGAINEDATVIFASPTISGVPCIMLLSNGAATIDLYWTSNGISTAEPGEQ